MTIGPIEESFALLNKYGLHYSSHDSERVDSLTYSWKKVNSQVRAYDFNPLYLLSYVQRPIVHKTISANFGVKFSLLFWFTFTCLFVSKQKTSMALQKVC